MSNNRKADRVQFQRAFPANLLGVDGTWSRACQLKDVSSTGARIEIEGTTEVLRAKEFFLVLSSTGLAFRRCEMVWIDGTTVGIRFLINKPDRKSQRRVAGQ
ncbi:MAG TPA: PilZ domain-containing protein [Bradyrhizobium sp.]|uniref:PilZ domain-containing protein n=1 Tax=Bradyrhizobium sp. TaxID=376 RepID=UPI002D7E551D|nr:PilZ domain-containing protein [Bradyrhizobium sp.]HET7889075.1 PilZ domain-containing protein [Bradyrhizobium sp.]